MMWNRLERQGSSRHILEQLLKSSQMSFLGTHRGLLQVIKHTSSYIFDVRIKAEVSVDIVKLVISRDRPTKNHSLNLQLQFLASMELKTEFQLIFTLKLYCWLTLAAHSAAFVAEGLKPPNTLPAWHQTAD